MDKTNRLVKICRRLDELDVLLGADTIPEETKRLLIKEYNVLEEEYLGIEPCGGLPEGKLGT